MARFLCDLAVINMKIAYRICIELLVEIRFSLTSYCGWFGVLTEFEVIVLRMRSISPGLLFFSYKQWSKLEVLPFNALKDLENKYE